MEAGEPEVGAWAEAYRWYCEDIAGLVRFGLRGSGQAAHSRGP